MAIYINEPSHTFNEYLLIPGYSSSECIPANVSLKTPLVKYKKGEKGTARISAAILDEEVFRQHYDVLAESTMDLTAFSNTNIEGTINCNRDGVLYTSVPQNGNWSVYVDGKPAQALTVCHAMVGVMLTEGEHTIQIVYHNEAFSLGWKISLACLLLFMSAYIYAYRPSLQILRRK